MTIFIRIFFLITLATSTLNAAKSNFDVAQKTILANECIAALGVDFCKVAKLYKQHKDKFFDEFDLQLGHFTDNILRLVSIDRPIGALQGSITIEVCFRKGLRPDRIVDMLINQEREKDHIKHALDATETTYPNLSTKKPKRPDHLITPQRDDTAVTAQPVTKAAKTATKKRTKQAVAVCTEDDLSFLMDDDETPPFHRSTSTFTAPMQETMRVFFGTPSSICYLLLNLAHQPENRHELFRELVNAELTKKNTRIEFVDVYFCSDARKPTMLHRCCISFAHNPADGDFVTLCEQHAQAVNEALAEALLPYLAATFDIIVGPEVLLEDKLTVHPKFGSNGYVDVGFTYHDPKSYMLDPEALAKAHIGEQALNDQRAALMLAMMAHSQRE